MANDEHFICLFDFGEHPSQSKLINFSARMCGARFSGGRKHFAWVANRAKREPRKNSHRTSPILWFRESESLFVVCAIANACYRSQREKSKKKRAHTTEVATEKTLRKTTQEEHIRVGSVFRSHSPSIEHFRMAFSSSIRSVSTAG